MARAHLDAADHAAARTCLLRATHLFPWDAKLRFNLAYILQVWAVRAGCACVCACVRACVCGGGGVFAGVHLVCCGWQGRAARCCPCGGGVQGPAAPAHARHTTAQEEAVKVFGDTRYAPGDATKHRHMARGHAAFQHVRPRPAALTLRPHTVHASALLASTRQPPTPHARSTHARTRTHTHAHTRTHNRRRSACLRTQRRRAGSTGRAWRCSSTWCSRTPSSCAHSCPRCARSAGACVRVC
jgi:hypothetical protein